LPVVVLQVSGSNLLPSAPQALKASAKMWLVLSSNAVMPTWTRVQYAELQQVPAMLQKGALGMVLAAR